MAYIKWATRQKTGFVNWDDVEARLPGLNQYRYIFKKSNQLFRTKKIALLNIIKIACANCFGSVLPTFGARSLVRKY